MASAGSRAGLDRTFAALSDPTRRAILARLRRRPARVGELANPFEMSFAAVSKHVRVLERAGLIRREVCGREHLCHLDARPLRAAAAWADGYRRFWEQRLDALESFLRDGGRPRARAEHPRRRRSGGSRQRSGGSRQRSGR